MEREKFVALLCLIVPQVIELIVKNNNIDEILATNLFYSSKVYAVLEEEETKVWHFSPMCLFDMFSQEQKTGSFEFPEET